MNKNILAAAALCILGSAAFSEVTILGINAEVSPTNTRTTASGATILVFETQGWTQRSRVECVLFLEDSSPYSRATAGYQNIMTEVVFWPDEIPEGDFTIRCVMDPEPVREPRRFGS